MREQLRIKQPRVGDRIRDFTFPPVRSGSEGDEIIAEPSPQEFQELLSLEDEKRLCDRIHNGDERARMELVEAFVPWVKKLVGRINFKGRRITKREDIIQDIFITLWEKTHKDKYDGSTRFYTYVYKAVKGVISDAFRLDASMPIKSKEMIDYVRAFQSAEKSLTPELGGVSRKELVDEAFLIMKNAAYEKFRRDEAMPIESKEHTKHVRAVEDAKKFLTQKLGRSVLPEEIMDYLVNKRVSREDVEKAYDVWKTEDFASLDHPENEDGETANVLDFTHHETGNEIDQSPETLVARSQIMEAFYTCLATLEPREQRVIKRVFGLRGNEEMSQDKIALLEGGISGSRIGQIKDLALRRFKERLSYFLKLQPGEIEHVLDNLADYIKPEERGEEVAT